MTCRPWNGFCDQALWLEAGCIQAQGDPRQVIDAYRQEVARREMSQFRQEEAPQRCPLPEERLLSKDRWGNGDIEISRVRLLDGLGQERQVFQDGEDLLVEMNYQVHRPTDGCCFRSGRFRRERDLLLWDQYRLG